MQTQNIHMLKFAQKPVKTERFVQNMGKNNLLTLEAGFLPKNACKS
jgi:hypothetical protein